MKLHPWVRIATALLSCLLAAGAAFGQGADPGRKSFGFTRDGAMPPWLVPVLRLVSSEYVEPVTGIVLSDTGLVLVPDDFASPGDEIVVLDGGTDIVRNGRPAHLQKRYPDLGLKLLAVPGLTRAGAPLATAPPAEGAPLVLTAFPPAKQIEQGAPPLHLSTNIDRVPAGNEPGLSLSSALPNVTGALIDTCGGLAAVSLAHGVPGMDPDPGTRYRRAADLLGILEELQLPFSRSECPQPAESEATQPEPQAPEAKQDIPEQAPPDENTPEEKQATQADEAEPPADDISGPESEETEPALPDIDVLPPLNDDGAAEQTPETEPPARAGWWALAALVFFGLGIALHLWRRSSRAAGPGTGTVALTPGVVDDPPGAGAENPHDSEFRVRGQFADGSQFEAACPVSAQAVNLIIGRGAAADLGIGSAAVSRQHAQINGDADSLTIADLGSSNGSSVNGIPCMEGEILFIEPGDLIVLGDVSFGFEIVPAGGDGDRK